MIKLPSALRDAMYIISVFVNAFVAVLISSDVVLSVWVLAVVAGYNAVVALVAKAYLTKE